MNLQKGIELLNGHLRDICPTANPDLDDAICMGRDAIQRIIDLRHMKERVRLYDDLPGEKASVLNTPGDKEVIDRSKIKAIPFIPDFISEIHQL